MNRILIETIVRNAIKDMKDSPARSFRNLVDMGLNFANGRFQQQFLTTVQEMLQNENSAYYRVAQDVVYHVDNERLITFGMNLGYNSCTRGAKTIRKTEETEGFDIPWSMCLKIDGKQYAPNKVAYDALFKSGKKLGIYTWLLFSDHEIKALIPLVEKNKDCAFVVFCHPNDIDDNMLDDIEGIHNLMLAVEYQKDTDDTAEACAKLRRREFLYSVYFNYGEADLEHIESGDLWYSTEAMHPSLTLLLATQSCSEETRHKVYDIVVQTRVGQQYATVPWDVLCDNCYVDSVISDRACAAAFDTNGDFYSLGKHHTSDEYNLFKNDLKSILKRAFPKKAMA